MQTSPRQDENLIEGSAQTEFQGIDITSQTKVVPSGETASQTTAIADTKESADQTVKDESEKYQQTSQPLSPVLPSPEKTPADKVSTEVTVSSKIPTDSSAEESLEVIVETRVTLSDGETKKQRKERRKRKWVEDSQVVVHTTVGLGSTDESVKEVSTNIPTPPIISDHSPGPPEEPNPLEATTELLSNRFSYVSSQNNNSATADALFIATREFTEDFVDLDPLIALVEQSIKTDDQVAGQEALITAVETISNMLEDIEYQIVVSRKKVREERLQDVCLVTANVDKLDKSINSLVDIVSYANVFHNSSESVAKCMRTLQDQVCDIRSKVNEEQKSAEDNLGIWEEFLNGVNNVTGQISETRRQLDQVLNSETSTHLKLEELERIEADNRILTETSTNLVIQSKEFPVQDIPIETESNKDECHSIESAVVLERERLLQLLTLADEYEQTLKEFAQIIEVAHNLVRCDVTITSLVHLQDEMQKHRKFFVNLSHCQGILESLEGNLDAETRSLHRDLHERLHARASTVLDAAAARSQQMSLAASRWTILEQGAREQQQWLQVAHQRHPDLYQVSTSDHLQYISLYQVC